jgi:hypothetical protein
MGVYTDIFTGNFSFSTVQIGLTLVIIVRQTDGSVHRHVHGQFQLQHCANRVNITCGKANSHLHG